LFNATFYDKRGVKRMVKAKTLVILSVLLLAVTGCGFAKGKDNPQASAQFVATGTEGIVMNFLADQPPAKVYTQGPLTFIVEVRNRGTYTVPSATFYLTGFDPSMLPGLTRYVTLSAPLEGKSQYNPEGGYSTLTFTEPSLSLSSNMPNYRPNFLLTACYPYTTVATPLVCIDPNPLDTTSDKACRVQKSYATTSQGAPVAVTAIESEARPTGMYFRIHITNTAGGTQQASGTVFKQSMMSSCPAGLQYSDLNVMQYAVSISNQPLKCEPQNGEIRLVNNKATLFCRYENLQKIPAYETPIEVKLTYGYKNSISKMVEIENLNFAR
jgi:hypothetical protein